MKALTDEQIEEVRRRYAAGETQTALSKEFHVSAWTIGNYVRKGIQANAEPAPAEKPQQDPEPAAEPQPETTDLYEVARGFEIFIKNHTAGDFFISLSRSNGVTLITAAAGDEEITIKRKESTS